jgi:hypothetical protein
MLFLPLIMLSSVSAAQSNIDWYTAENVKVITLQANDVTAAGTDSSRTSNSPIVTSGIAGDGVNVISNARLSAVISGNVSGNGILASSTGAGGAGVSGSISGDAFAGAKGITMVNMNSGNNSSVQSTVTVTLTSGSR